MLSIIIPFVAESPQLFFTLQSLQHELRGKIDYEIILIDNATTRISESQHPEINCSLYIQRKSPPNVKLLAFSDVLSHWQAKNYGVSQASGSTLFFIDAHCLIYPDSLLSMYKSFIENRDGLASYHMPISYLLENKPLCYELVHDTSNGILDYRFKEFIPEFDWPGSISPVSCMSTCGMMISKELFNSVGPFPESLGPYSGGEQFLNFTMGRLGYLKYVYNSPPLQHYAAPRGYTVSNLDIARNKLIAMYLVGGASFMHKRAELFKQELPPSSIDRICFGIKRDSNLEDKRNYIETNSIFSVDDFIRFWS